VNQGLLHHPDVSLTVVRRRAADFFLDLVMFYGEVAFTRGRSLTWSSCFRSHAACRTAVSRLRKKGVVTIARRRDGRRVLCVAPGHEVPPALHPETYWRKPWDGLWRVLVYDVPEAERSFRNGLRRFLCRLRMGCLQQSVWISPWDIRPDYADLQTTLDLDTISVLFEARTVLGRSSSDLVREAWDFEYLSSVHRAYIANCDEHLKQLRSAADSHERVEAIARQEMMDFLHAMASDPLLPRKLLPATYSGFEAYERHTQVMQAVRRCVAS
jgi:phenylacetic acid degradation operon negative regulatory protein